MSLIPRTFGVEPEQVKGLTEEQVKIQELEERVETLEGFINELHNKNIQYDDTIQRLSAIVYGNR